MDLLLHFSRQTMTSLTNRRILPGNFCCHGESPSICSERKSYGTIESENMSFGSRRAMTNSSRSPFTVVTSQQYQTFSVSLSFVVFCHPILFNFTTRIGNWRDENQGLYLTAICHRIHVAPVRGEKSPAQSCNANHEAQYGRELCTHLNIFFGWFFFSCSSEI